jgi:peptidoglycan/LPS O-acetylase OafA/YrhL
MHAMHESPPKYFPALDELRFLAAFAIVILHVEDFKDLHGYANCLEAVKPLRMGVTFFFVLSGFLITYLLLAERKESRTVAVGSFYMRRALRIWPLYFVIVALGLFVLPWIRGIGVGQLTDLVWTDLPLKALVFGLFLPNLALILYPAVPYAAQTWSIGVEEQFYLTWPLLFKFLGRAWIGMIAVVVAAAGARILAAHVLEDKALTQFLTLTRIGCMAIGGLAAYLVFHEHRRVLAVIYHPLMQLAAPVLLGYVVYRQLKEPFQEVVPFAFPGWRPWASAPMAFTCIIRWPSASAFGCLAMFSARTSAASAGA